MRYASTFSTSPAQKISLGEQLDKFATTLRADYRFAPLNALFLVAIFVIGLVVHLSLYSFNPTTVLLFMGSALALAVILRLSQVWEAVVIFGTADMLSGLPPAAAGQRGAVDLRSAGGFAGALDTDRLPVGTRRGPQVREIPGAAEAGCLRHFPGGRQGGAIRRPAHPRHGLQRRDDPHLRHGAGERGCHCVLDGLGRPEGGAGSGAVREGGHSLRSDGAQERNRQERPCQPSFRARPPRPRDPEGAGRENECVGCHDPGGRDPRHHHPERPRGCHEPPGAGRTRAPEPDHPGHRGDRDCREVRPGLGCTTRTTRSPFIFAP